ncbi:MAG: hypothetical protein V3R87_04080 [Dehalococcoidia bacterium]
MPNPQIDEVGMPLFDNRLATSSLLIRNYLMLMLGTTRYYR